MTSPGPEGLCSTLLSCFPEKYCNHTLFPASAEATAAYPPLPPHPLAQTLEPHCSFPAILPFLLHFLVAMETRHLRTVRRLGNGSIRGAAGKPAPAAPVTLAGAAS